MKALHQAVDEYHYWKERDTQQACFILYCIAFALSSSLNHVNPLLRLGY